jgi:type II restriction/modification system DNA methylase subunit YeeA
MTMTSMTPAHFVKKWSKIQLKERTSAQSHFNDICALVEHKPPLEADPKGEFFTFEADTDKPGGEHGWADAWYKGRFIWEYKSPDKNLDAAYKQLLLYKDALGNPPLLITSDTQVIIIHTNFTNTLKHKYEIDFDRIEHGDGVDLLKRAFYEPQSFRPAETQEQVTQATADEFVEVANTLQKWGISEGIRISPEKLAHFLIRLLFCLFAEDIGLLPNDVFSKLAHAHLNSAQFGQSLQTLFANMRTGGMFGVEAIPFFDGGLFDDDSVPQNMPGDVAHTLRKASEHDWSAIDPSIFGTLFERIIDESKRAQLGAHYTSKEDILLVVEPVLMQPLRTKWQTIKFQVNNSLKLGLPDVANTLLKNFSEEIAALRVLDPACGSGNFLYIALRQLLDLQKEIVLFAFQKELAEIQLSVGPHQLYGIEINPYAYELAQITVWIGYLQWRTENGFTVLEEPILKPLHQIENKDAILEIDAVKEPVWPEADVIIGNPPFLGGKRLRIGLGDKYVEALYKLYEGRIPHEADLVCYWFEKARAQIEDRQAGRAGLLATQGIRGGANRKVLDRIKATGDIFWAQSDRDWILDGANVHVSMVGFDDGTLRNRTLDDHDVFNINPNLTTALDITIAKRLGENANISFMGDTKVGPFEVNENIARKMLDATGNPNNRPNSDVVKPWINGFDVTRRPQNMWIVDFGLGMTEKEAKQYILPFEHISKWVKPFRLIAKSGDCTGIPWWLHQRPRPEMRGAVKNLERYIVTPCVSKYRLFVWVSDPTLVDHAVIAFARSDDYFLGILHSKVHELWARGKGSQLREVESGFRYTPTTTFETFPFPWPPGYEPLEDVRVQAVSDAAKQLDEFRNAWLNPPAEEIGVTISQRMLERRTLTNLYNALTTYREKYKGKMRDPRLWSEAVKGVIGLEEIETLDHIHHSLDQAVLDAYGWEHNLSDEQILEKLLALNLQRAKPA